MNTQEIHHGVRKIEAVAKVDRVALTGDTTASTADKLAALESLAFIAWQVDHSQRALVTQLRAQGVTWQKIGDALEVTRSAAQQRFSP